MALIRLLTSLLVLYACTVQAASTPKDTAPKRIVVLEYSFVDALAVIGISPVGVADDKDPTRIIPQVRDLIEPWTSVGMRSQPNLEVIAQLKPDLIIADSYRHKISLHDLSQIAPTILLKSRGETYQEGLESALAIGKAVGKEQEMKARLAKHRELMASYKGKFKANGTVQFANVNERGMWMHGPLSYTGSLLSYLGLQPALPDLKQSHLMEANLEVLLKVNPDWLFYSKRAGYAVLDNWHKSPLFKLLKINKTGQEIQVSPELWSLNRGILAAESIAKELDTIIEKTST
ncbi:Fe(3+) dicitrate ABC transporter substrate-binding protein [Vibrio sp. dhg]|uniref:Fe(3+) dicitrate ABC transporter substrate-binding protein n=1 Tax=Vibrio sp. dhg TaxID=2163016 RepID=UPI000E522624|nr:Fe(3+) dicitrate ABC transporter substrate-binding protein [Vibrio sp. dhg]AXT71344.1 iron siderophore-binding protein [Vibrio sp. dhg]